MRLRGNLMLHRDSGLEREIVQHISTWGKLSTSSGTYQLELRSNFCLRFQQVSSIVSNSHARLVVYFLA